MLEKQLLHSLQKSAHILPVVKLLCAIFKALIDVQDVLSEKYFNGLEKFQFKKAV